MGYRKKLIEVALPLDAINEASAREKSIRHGHPSTLHLWWARRPLAAARAVLWSSLVDDPSSHPEEFPTEEAQIKERERLFAILEKLVKWENSNDPVVLAEAKAEIMKSTGGNPPELLDPFAGGGSIPLEAQRLGLKAHACDLNPVAVIINKSLIEFPSIFSGIPSVNPNSMRLDKTWDSVSGLAEDIYYYGGWLKNEAIKKIGYLYPKVKVPKEQGGGEASVIAWIWTRTIKCPNPACGCEMPLIKSLDLSKKSGKEAHIKITNLGNSLKYSVHLGKSMGKGTIDRQGAICACCQSPVDFAYIRNEAQNKRMNAKMIAIIGEGRRGRIFCNVDEKHIEAANVAKPKIYPTGELSGKSRANVSLYGINQTSDLFSNRQLLALTTLSNLIETLQAKVYKDAIIAGMEDDAISISEGGKGALAYSQVISTYLAFLIDQLTNHSSTVCGWNAPNTQMRSTFSRQAIQMVWDYAECNIFSDSSGSFTNLLDRMCKGFSTLGTSTSIGIAKQFDAQSDLGIRNVMVSTDPPYYDNIAYADLSDFFYVWLRSSIKNYYPKLFQTMLVPKAEELVATPYRFNGNKKQAKDFFEEGLFKTFQRIHDYCREDIPVTIYYAYKQGEDGEELDIANEHQSGSSGWETILSALINAGFSLSGTWPIRTEKPGRSVGIDANALASSIVLVCRKREMNAPTCTRRDFINTLKRELKVGLNKLQSSNIAPVDLAQSAIGPGIGVFSKFSRVLEADGTPMTVRSALQIINQELDLYFTEQDGELDCETRFCIDLYMQYAFNDVAFGEADVLARAKNTSVDRMAHSGLLHAQKGVVRLRTRDEISKTTDGETIWLLTQQLTSAIENSGVLGAAGIVCDILTSEPEQAKALAYRLYTIAERKGWAGEAYAYNSLVVAWPEVQFKAAELRSKQENGKQMRLFETDNK